jgi:hypothetical protein
MEPSLKGRNLVGIIPITGREDKLNLPWSDCLQPLADGVLAIERSVHECAQIGCDSIWIICNDNSAPLIKKRLGDYVVNPYIYENWKYKRMPDGQINHIPIFYTPVLQKHRNRTDTLGWSVLHGALTSFVVANKISKWVVPSCYYVSFPYGIYNVKSMNKVRGEIRAGKKVYGEYNGKTVRDGLYLPFSFTPEDWLLFRRQLNENNTGGDKSLPIQERWSAKHFTLDKIFNHDKIDIDKKVEIKSYHTLDSWEELKSFYESETKIHKMSKKMNKPFNMKG